MAYIKTGIIVSNQTEVNSVRAQIFRDGFGQYDFSVIQSVNGLDLGNGTFEIQVQVDDRSPIVSEEHTF